MKDINNKLESTSMSLKDMIHEQTQFLSLFQEKIILQEKVLDLGSYTTITDKNLGTSRFNNAIGAVSNILEKKHDTPIDSATKKGT